MKAELCEFDEKGEIETISNGEINVSDPTNSFIGYGGDIYMFSETETNEDEDVAIFVKGQKIDFEEKEGD